MANTTLYPWLKLGTAYITRQWGHHGFRTALSVLGVALGVAVLLAIQLANQSTLLRFKENVSLVAGQTNASIVPNADVALNESILDNLAPLIALGGQYAPVLEGRAVIPPEKSSLKSNTPGSLGALAGVPVQVLGVDMATDSQFRPFQFSKPPEFAQSIFQKNRVYISETLANTLQLTVGDAWPLLIQDQQVKLIIAGIVANKGPGLAYGGQLVLMDIANAQVLFRQTGRLNRVDLHWPDTVSQHQVKASLSLPNSAMWVTPAIQQEQTAGMVKAFQTNLTALSLIALLVAGFLIYNTLSLAMLRRRRDIATLRTLGASINALLAWFIVELVMLGILGSLLGTLIGSLLAINAVDAVSSTVGVLYTGMPVHGVVIPWPTVLVCFLFGVLTTVAAGLVPVVFTLLQSPAQALRRWSEEQHQPIVGYGIASVLALVATYWASQQPPVEGFPLFGHASSFLLVVSVALAVPVILPALLWASKHCWQGVLMALSKALPTNSIQQLLPVSIHQLNMLRGRTSVAIASLMVALSMAISLTIMIHSFRQTVEAWVTQSITADLWIEADGYNVGTKRQLDAALVDTVRQVSGVAAVDPFLERPFQYQGKATRLAVGDFTVFKTHGNLQFLSGESSPIVLSRALASGGVLVTEPFATRFGVSVGSTLTIPTAHGNIRLPVEGIYRDYASEQGYLVLDRREYQRHFMYGNALSGMAIYAKPGTDVDSLRVAVLKALPTETRLNVATRHALRQEIFRIFDNTFAITYALHAIAITVALLGILITLLALVMATRREFGILSWLGVPANTLQQLVLLQGTTLCVLGCLLGCGVGIGLSQFLVTVINKQSFGWTIDYHIPVVSLLGLMLALCLAGVLVSFVPARIASRPLTPQGLKEEH